MYTKALRRTALMMSGFIAVFVTAVAMGLAARQMIAPRPDGCPAGPVAGLREAVQTLVPTLEPTVVPTPTPTPTPELTPTPTPESTPEPTPEPRTARIRAVGDLMVHQRQLDMAKGEDGSYDFHPQYARIADVLADAD